MSKKSFIGGTIILVIAGLIVRILGFFYRIYLSNLIGAEGMGLFGLISPVYSLVILTLTSGISIAVSQMVAAENARGHDVNLKRITRCALLIVCTAGIIVSVIMYLFAGFIVDTVLKDSRTYYSLILLIPCIPVIAAASAIKGYFYGLQDVTPTAVSQIVEQLVRIGLVLAAASYFVDLGIEYACAVAVAGMSIGEIANLAVVYIVYTRKNKQVIKSRNGLMRKRTIITNIMKISLPVSFNRFITSIMSATESILIPRRLLAGGLDYSSSIAEFGRLTGMTMPLLFFPSIVTSSLSTTLVSALSEAMSVKNYRSVNYRISKSIQLSFIMGFIFAAIFFAYPHEIGNLFYKRENIGELLKVMSFTCVFMYLQQTLLGVLNGLGKQGISLRNSVIGYLIRISFVYYAIPLWGINGYVWGILTSSVVVCILNLSSVMRTTGMNLDLGNWIVKPGIVGMVMALSGKYILCFFSIFSIGKSLTIIMAVTGTVAIAFFLMIITGVMDKNEFLRLAGIKKGNTVKLYKK